MIPNCKKKEDNFLNKYYPIGSIYMNINPEDPNKIWGGGYGKELKMSF